MEPILAYRFYIRILNAKKNTVMRAQNVSGLTVNIGQSEFKTIGGLKKVPSDVTYNNLILKRAVLEQGDTVGINTMDLLNKLQVERIDLGIHLLDARGKYTRSWNVIGAYTVKWSISDVDATSNKVIMETLEFNYKYLREIK